MIPPVDGSTPGRLGPFAACSSLSWSAPLPELLRVRRHGATAALADIDSAVISALEPVRSRVRPGSSVAVTAGSRGIADAVAVYRSVGRLLSDLGARPFLVAAMGSHGGGTAAGRLRVLEHLGVTEERVGMPVVSTDELAEIGKLDEAPVLIAREAVDADLLLAVNRVKPHTDFHGPIESGIAKILAVGLGKQPGAMAVHAGGPGRLASTIRAVAEMLVATGKVLGGLAVLENERHAIARLAFLEPDEIGQERETALLEEARGMLAKLPFEELDVLVVDELGKEISGAGIDPNAIGRMRIEGVPEPDSLRIAVLVVLGLTGDTSGNGTGIGLADLTTLRAIGQIDLAATYLNALTAGLGGIRRVALPLALPTDRDAICAALASCGEPRAERRRVVCVRNTLALSELLISESLREAVVADPSLEIVGEVGQMPFDDGGSFVGWSR